MIIHVVKPYTVHSLLNDKILDMAKLKAFVDDKSKVTKMRFFLSDTAENVVRKGAFSPFPTVFFKACFKAVKSRNCEVNS